MLFINMLKVTVLDLLGIDFELYSFAQSLCCAVETDFSRRAKMPIWDLSASN